VAAKWDGTVVQRGRCKACAAEPVLSADQNVFNKTADVAGNNLNMTSAGEAARLPSDVSSIADRARAGHTSSDGIRN
jgi:hypothetical protein